MQNKKVKRNCGLFLLPLLCLTLFVGAMATGVTYSSYTSSSSGGDSTTVAKFNVDVVLGTVRSLQDASGNGLEKAEIPIIIDNNSEVTVTCDLVMTLPGELPSHSMSGYGVVASANGVEGTVSGNTITVSNCATLAAGEQDKEVLLVIGSESMGESGISDLKSLTYVGASIEVYTTQVD